ncbi:unnamed protein product [Strongylus vulgaris]|uniref:Uncharacterized protein n=1 Tax=Strongylus vulgaris TaxID=40348 RepID=A0A3P7IXM9_STRVU|nr:unnamed protein product [Strongylus vulgaris]
MGCSYNEKDRRRVELRTLECIPYEAKRLEEGRRRWADAFAAWKDQRRGLASDGQERMARLLRLARRVNTCHLSIQITDLAH